MHFVVEKPNSTFDKKKFDRILFIIDKYNCLSFKKLQIYLKKQIKIIDARKYEIHKLDSEMSLIVLPKINFNNERLEATINNFKLNCQSNAVERIAINCCCANFRTYQNIKCLIRVLFAKTDISITLFTGTQIEITDIGDINEILRAYHRSILGGHRGFERMKNTIRAFYIWPTINHDIKKYISNCEICEKAKINRHTHTPMQITSVASVASAPFEKVYIDFVGEINPNSIDGHKYIMTMCIRQLFLVE